jgi:hypothetical protein
LREASERGAESCGDGAEQVTHFCGFDSFHRVTVLCWPDEAAVVVDDVDDASTHDPSAARRISRHTGLL